VADSRPSTPPRATQASRAALVWLGRFGLVLAISCLLIGLVGVFRLARQFPSASSSPSLLVPFLFPVLALAIEAGALVALSSAHVSLLARCAGKLAARAWATLPLLLVTLLVLSAAQLVPRGTEHPGRFANELIESALGSCAGSGEVSVPLLGLTVRCSEPPRISGPMPGVRSVHVGMRQLTFSDDLRRIEISELELEAKRALSVKLRARSAIISGIAPWARSPRLSTLGRWTVLALMATALWGVGCGLSRPLASAPASAPSARLRLLAALLAGLPGALIAAGFIVLEQEQAAPLSYAAAGAAGLVALGGLRLLVRRVPQMFSSSDSF
jgi:hypothetical protein